MCEMKARGKIRNIQHVSLKINKLIKSQNNKSKKYCFIKKKSFVYECVSCYKALS